MDAGRTKAMGVTAWHAPTSSEQMDIQVTNRPAVRVQLSAQPDPITQRAMHLHARGFVDVGKPKGNIGSQNYAIPQGANINAHKSIVINYVPWGVIFSVAPLGCPKHVSGALECPPLTNLQACSPARRLPDNLHRLRRRLGGAPLPSENLVPCHFGIPPALDLS